MKRLPITLLVLVTAFLLSFSGCALAEEQLTTATVELYSAGSFAAPTALPRTYAAQTFEELMTDYLSSMSDDVINLSDYNLDYETEFLPMYQALLNKHPEWFYISNSFGVRTDDDDDGDGIADSTEENLKGLVLKFQAIYKYTGDELTNMTAVYNNGVAAVVDYAMEADTTVGRILRANDYLCANYKYDTRVQSADEATRDETIYSPELFFKEGTGVCQAYMLAFDAAMQELGVECEAVTSDAMNHTWNQVKVDGKWYHVDTTWNDPLTSQKDVPLRVLHTYLLVSDSALSASHHDWDALATATSTKYDNYFWSNLRHAAPMVGDVVYYVDDSSSMLKPTLCSFNLATGSTSRLFAYQSYSSSNGVTFYRDSHAIWAGKNLIFYAWDNKLVAVQPNGTKPVMLYQNADTAKRIYHMYEKDGMLKMHFADAPDSTGQTLSIYMFDSLLTVPVALEAEVGDRVKLYSSVSLGGSTTWSSSNTDVASVSASGLVEIKRKGAANITAAGSESSAVSAVIVRGDTVLSLPSSLETISDSAFAGLPVEEVVLPDTVASIGASAFAGCEGLYLINLPEPENGLDIDPAAFADCDNLTLLCSSDEAVAAAEVLGIPAVRLP